MRSWRPALRMARRDLRRHKVRAVLTCLLVTLPVFVATVAALAAYNNRWDQQREAKAILFGADATVTVTEWSAVRPQSAVGWTPLRARGATQRDTEEIDVASMLPEGSTLAPRPSVFSVDLLTGGSLNVMSLDSTNPLTSGLVEITRGRAPESPDEVALPEAMADELGLLTSSGVPEADATFDLVDGFELRVVGVVGRTFEGYDFGDPDIVAPQESVLPRDELENGPTPGPAFLVDLPELTVTETKALVEELAAQGVALRPRDAIVHPADWGTTNDYSTDPVLDLTPVLVGALCVLVGLVEVVLLVGAAFSVAARRQVRDLGLMAANGGAALHLRRVLLAQGMVLGVLSSVVGTAGGALAFHYLADGVYARLDQQLWHNDVSWPALVVIVLLGSLTSVVAALLPAWKVSRLTPVQALSGRFPIKAGEARAHRPAFILTGVGLATLLAGGWAIAYTQHRYPSWVSAATVVTGIGLVVLVAGTVWCTPYVVRRVAELGRGLPLSGRYAFRDAGRHRFRSAAAVMALMITVAGAVLVGFGFRSGSRSALEDSLPPNTISIDLWDTDGEPNRVAAARSTVERIADPLVVATSFDAHVADRPNRYVVDLTTYSTVSVVDEASLREFVRADSAALAVFRSGGALATRASSVRDGRMLLGTDARRDPKQWSLSAAVVMPGELRTPVTPRTVFINADTATRLGLMPTSPSMVVRTADPVTEDVLDRLRLFGLYGWSDDPQRATIDLLQYAGLAGAALLTALVVGIAVALAAAESRDDVATLAAVGAGPMRRRGLGAMHGLFLGLVGSLLGVAVGLPAGLAFTQVDGLPGVDVPWLATLGTVAVVLPLSWAMGALVTPSRFRLTRRVA